MKREIISLIILTILCYSCKDENIIATPELTSTQACQDHLIAESIFNDVNRIIEEGITSNSQKKQYPKYTLINADTSNSDTLIVDFGNTNYLYNEKLRRGTINITYTGKYRDSLSTITSTFDNYYVNNNLVQGESIITNQGRNNIGNLWFTVNVENASINTPNGTINWNQSTVKEWVNGENTYTDISDDIYEITGSGSGNSVNGNNFMMTIIKPLHIHMGCLPYCIIKSGETTINPEGYSERKINYGEESCDCNVDVLIEDENYPIVISY